MRIFATMLLLLTAGAVGAEVRIDAYAEPDGDVYLGQRVRLVVAVRTDTWFTTAPRYPEIKVDGAIALLPEAFGTNFTEREGGQTRAGQRQRYVLFPQRVGELVIPPFEVSMAVSVDGRAGETQIATTPGVTINVVAPPGSADVSSFVTTPRLSVTEEWEGEIEGLKVGDAITRVVTQRADDVFALVLPAIEFAPIEGFAVYPATPVLEDRAERGSYSATRTDRVTYLLQSEGDYRLPDIEIHWFDPGSRKMVKETLEGIDISVAPNPDAVLGDGEAALEKPVYDIEATLRNALDWLAGNLHWLTLSAGALVALRWLWRRFVPAWMQSLREARERWRESERRYFDELLRAVRAGDEDRAVASFWRWADRLPGRTAPLTLPALADDSGGQGLANTWRTFEARRYGRHAEGAAGRMKVADLRRLRQSWLRDTRRPRPGSGRPGKQQLNP